MKNEVVHVCITTARGRKTKQWVAPNKKLAWQNQCLYRVTPPLLVQTVVPKQNNYHHVHIDGKQIICEIAI